MNNTYVYVVKVGKKYAKRRSYGEVTLKDNPLQASLYSRKNDALYLAKRTNEYSEWWKKQSVTYPQVDYSSKIYPKAKVVKL